MFQRGGCQRPPFFVFRLIEYNYLIHLLETNLNYNLMSNIKSLVKKALSWKQSPEITADRLGISVPLYIKLKKEILKENKAKRKQRRLKDNPKIQQDINIEKGQARISGVSSFEPKTPEEIIALLKIDTSKWRLSQYWNKQMSDHWRVSALVTKIKVEEVAIENLIANWNPKKIKVSEKKLTDALKNNRETVCGIMSLQDIHFGKEGNETVDKDFEKTVIDLITRGSQSHNIEKLYFVIGGDLINMDTFVGTTTSGTPVDNCMSATAAFAQAFDAMLWAIQLLLSYVDKLTIVYVPGNHDRLTSFHLVHGLSKAIDSDKIEWDVSYEERKVHVYHNNFNAFEHGDSNSKNTPVMYATEFPKKWGNTKNRTLFTGHYHTTKKIEYLTNGETAGFIHKVLPSLSKTDYWHYHKKFVGNKRAGKLELQSATKGNICELTYSPT